jgi:hypothetical protein
MEEELDKIKYLPWPRAVTYPEGCELIKFHPSSYIFSILEETPLKSRIVILADSVTYVPRLYQNTKETFYAFKIPNAEISNTSTIEFYVEANGGKLVGALRMRVNNTEFEHVRFSDPLIEQERNSFKKSLL